MIGENDGFGMSDKDDEIEWTMLEDGVEQEPLVEEDPAVQSDPDYDGPELFDQSYMAEDNKKPSWIMVAVVVFLILSVFWKKIMVTYTQNKQPQVEKTVEDKAQ